MVSPIGRAAEVYRNEGGKQLSAKALRSLRRRAALTYWRARGKRTFEIDGAQATFSTRGRAARSLRIFDRGEREMARDLLSELDEDDVFWDIGAHIGFHSCLGGQRAAEVNAFEPTPNAAERATDHLATNGVEASVHKCALWDTNETLTLDHQSAATGGSGSVTVSARRGDDIASDGVSPPNVVKIDVEGAEPRVVDGMAETLADEECRAVYCEVHRPAETRPSVVDHGSSVDEFCQSLRELGFTVETIADRGLDLHIKAHRN